MNIVAFLCAAISFLLLGLAAKPHHEARFGKRAGHHKRGLRVGGWAMLAVSFPASVAARGCIFGPIFWIGLVMAGAAFAFLLLNLGPQWPASQNPGDRSEPD